VIIGPSQDRWVASAGPPIQQGVVGDDLVSLAQPFLAQIGVSYQCVEITIHMGTSSAPRLRSAHWLASSRAGVSGALVALDDHVMQSYPRFRVLDQSVVGGCELER